MEVPAVLEGPSLSVTLTTGTCAIVKNSTQGKDLSDLLEDSLTCIGPELSYTKVCTLTCVMCSTSSCCASPKLQALVRAVGPRDFACSAASMTACIYRTINGKGQLATQGAPQHIV